MVLEQLKAAGHIQLFRTESIFMTIYYYIFLSVLTLILLTNMIIDVILII